MIKFKSNKKQQLEEYKEKLRNQARSYSIDILNVKYDEIISKFNKQKIVTGKTKELADELRVLQDEVNNRLETMRREGRVLDQQYNRSIITKEDFDMDYYKQVKDDVFKLESLSKALEERVSAINNNFFIRK